jgi:hypothetical protein
MAEEPQVKVVIAGARVADMEQAGKTVSLPATEARALVNDGRAQYVTDAAPKKDKAE